MLLCICMDMIERGVPSVNFCYLDRLVGVERVVCAVQSVSRLKVVG